VRYPNISVMFLPSAVVSGGVRDPMIRYHDGDSWRPPQLTGPTTTLTGNSPTAPPSKTATTTVTTRAPATVKVGQDTITLTATVTPTAAAGQVTFYKSPTGTGTWTHIGTAELAAGTAKAVKTYTPTPADRTASPNWWFRSVYNGSPTHATSTSAATNNPVRVYTETTLSGTITASWVQAYEEAGGQMTTP